MQSSFRSRLWTGVASPLLHDAWRQLPLASEWHPRSQRPSISPSLTLHKIKGKFDQNQIEKLTNIGMTNTLRKILKDQKARRDNEKFSITRLALPPLRALHKLYRLSHKLRDGLGLIVLPYVESEITGRFSFLGCGLPKRVPNRLTLILIRNVSTT
ncbi:hypothetical protein Cgig2_027183 [Carnegiea gigantea]|uniref:Uncharacterized protein n=1 Tax=Carnegiea gigantea TaxID=171969 RepID=A0A9Q1KUQ8_9CARY|nr:hypothetical protein Cgig2_027183 [Carnegiea gigantea]